jgi:hypothetical protein
MRKVKVVQNPENEIPLEVLATSIKDISEGIRKLNAGPLNEKALLLLIQHAAPTRNRMGQRYGIGEIKDILEGMENLEKTYLKTKKK